jgi:hypothetical protein
MLPLVQLFDLESDPAEARNVQAENPEIVARLTKLMEKYVGDGRSTPGALQSNNDPVDIWKAAREAHAPLPEKKRKKK